MDRNHAIAAMALADAARADAQTGHRLSMNVISYAAKLGPAPEPPAIHPASPKAPGPARTGSYPTPRQADEHAAPGAGETMALTIWDDSITSDRTAHTARPVADDGHRWEVSWLPGRSMDRNSAITAMVLADVTGPGDVTPGTGCGSTSKAGPPNSA